LRSGGEARGAPTVKNDWTQVPPRRPSSRGQRARFKQARRERKEARQRIAELRGEAKKTGWGKSWDAGTRIAFGETASATMGVAENDTFRISGKPLEFREWKNRNTSKESKRSRKRKTPTLEVKKKEERLAYDNIGEEDVKRGEKSITKSEGRGGKRGKEFKVNFNQSQATN